MGPGARRLAAAIVVVGGVYVTTGSAVAATEGRLQQVLERVVAEHRLVPGASMYVQGAREGLPFSGASGRIALPVGTALHPDDPYRLASVTKPFTAATILRLVEDGRLALDDRVAGYLPADLVNRMHVHGGVSYGPRITVRQLLNHTSGLNSHDECTENTVLVGAQPLKRWTPREQIELMIACGEPYFAPGKGWHYSDTGFVMLGSIITKVTGLDLAASFRALLPFAELGLDRTWHELLEPAPSGSRQRAHQYFAAFDLSRHDPSFDSWGGGGLDATNADVARFMRGLFDGRIFRKSSTLATMLETDDVARTPGGARWGLGLARQTVAGIECWGHTGFWSNFAGYCPDLDVAIAGTTNQASDEHGHGTDRFVYEGAIAVVAAAAARPRQIAVTALPRRMRAGRRITFRFTTTAGGSPLSATINFAGREMHSGPDGTATITARLRKQGRRRVLACKPRLICGITTVRVLPPHRRSPRRHDT